MTKLIDFLWGKYNLLILCLIFFVFVCLPVFFIPLNWGASDIFWDFTVYIDALERYKANQNPYLTEGSLKFVYPPIFLLVINIFSPYEKIFLITFYILAMYLLFSNKEMRLIGIFMFSSMILLPHNPPLPYIALETGNLTLFMHLFCLSLILKIKDWKSNNSFWILLMFFSLIKIYFLSYMIVPILINGLTNERYRILIVFAAIIASYLFQYFILPELFLGFIDALGNQTSPGNEIWSGDIGFGFYKFFLFFTQSRVFALLMHFILAAGLFFLVYANRIKIKNLSSRFLIYIGVILAIVSNPRLKIYDEVLIPALFLLLIFKLIRDSSIDKHAIYRILFIIIFLSYASFIIYQVWGSGKGYLYYLNKPIITTFIPIIASIYLLIFQKYQK